MPTNDFLSIAIAGSPNVLDQADYLASTNREQGWPTGGVPTAAEWNKMVRQASVITSQLAQLIVDVTGLDMLDNGSTAVVLASLKSMLQLIAATANYAEDTGAADALVVTLAPALTAAVVGMPIYVNVAHNNTGATTINVNGLGAVAVQSAGAVLAADALLAGVIYTFMFDGTVYQVESAGGSGGGGGGALLAVNNLSDVASVPASQTSLNVPTRTGGNASGTWPIDISGTAVTATTAATANALNAGNTYTAVDFVATSDERLKDIGEPVTGVLDKIEKVQVFRYRWNSKARELGFSDTGENIGVSAQDIQAIDPSLVTEVTHTKTVQVGTRTVGEGDDAVEEPVFEEQVLGSFLGVDANDTIALLFQAVKELRAEIKQLRGKKG